jgi:adenine phosphoribosyltransferase
MPTDLKSAIRTVPDWPKPGVMFRDITTLLKEPAAFQEACRQLVARFENSEVDLIAGVEARGFIFGSVMAYLMNVPFVPVRKPGKLPAETVGEEYALEYGTDAIEVHRDAIAPGARVLVVDDLVATGGTVQAACRLIEKLGGAIVGCAFVIALPDLGGLEKLGDYDVHYLVAFEGD